MEAQHSVAASVSSHCHVHPVGEDTDDDGFTAVSMGPRKKLARSYAAKAQGHDLQRSGMEPVRKKQPVFGTSVTNHTVKSVDAV